MATIVTNVEGSPRSRPRSPGVCQPARTCGESSIPPLLIYFADFVFARRTQVTTSSLMRRCSTPTMSMRRIRSPFSSRCGRRRTPAARVVGAGGGRGYGRAGGREGTRMRRAVAAERERMGKGLPIEDTGILNNVSYCSWVVNTEVGFRLSAKCFRHFAVTQGEQVGAGAVLPRTQWQNGGVTDVTVAIIIIIII